MKTKQLPQGWKEIALGEIFEFENKTGIKAGEGLEEGRYKFFTSSDNQSKFLDRFNFKGEHLIFSTGGKAGLHYCNEPFSVSNDCFIVKVKSHSTKFIYYLLKSKIYLLEKGFKGAGLKHLSKDYLKKIKVELPFLPDGTPDLKEQERIVKILEENERQIKRADRAEELLSEYLKSVFNEMFGNPRSNPKKWNLVQTKDLFDMKLGKMLSARNYTGKYLRPYLRNINVQWGYLDLRDIKQMDFDEKEFPKYLLKKGDILVCEGGEVGRTAIYNGEIKDCCYQNALHRLRVKNNSIERVYFVYFMIFANKHGLIKRDTIQVTIAHFTEEKFKRFKVMLPPLSLQQKFSRIVEQVEKMKENVNKTKQNAEELFNSLMTKAFKGEL